MISSATKKKRTKQDRGYFLLQLMTLGRIPFAILFLVILVYGKDTRFRFVLTLALLLIIEFTDLFDGIIARRHGLVSESGATLDPFADSVSRLIVYWALATKELVILLVPLIMALRDITVAYSRIVLAQNSRSVSAKKSGKVKATVQAIGAYLALFGPFYWGHIGRWSYYILSWIIITVTVISAIAYVKDALSTSRLVK